MSFIFIFFASFYWSSSYAQEIELQFGPEFTLSNDIIISHQTTNGPNGTQSLYDLRDSFFNNPQLKIYHQKLIDHLKNKLIAERPPAQAFKCFVKEIESENRVVFQSPNGWQAMLGIDTGVFEWTMPPHDTSSVPSPS